MKIPEEVIQSIKEFQESMADIGRQLAPLFKKIEEGFKLYLEGAPGNYYELSRYGWYLDMDITPKETHELGKLAKQKKSDELDIKLTKYYSSKLKHLESKLCNNNSHRSHIFSEAFQAHRNKKYYSSISLLLTQADGICYDLTSKFYFRNDPNLSRKKIYRPEVQEEIAKGHKGVMDFILTPISKPTAINEYSKNVADYPVRLNRHEILHGIDYEYGTKTNSLKVISFINYVDDIIFYIRNDNTSPNK